MKTENLSALEFCILVTWIHGWTITKIHMSFTKRRGKTENAVRGIINKLPKRRQDMNRAERQTLLDEFKATRIDDGMLPAEYFAAKVLSSDQKMKARAPEKIAEPAQVEPAPDPNTRAGRKELSRRRKEAKRKEEKAKLDKARREEGMAPRGVSASPLEYLHDCKALTKPGDDDANAPEGRANNAMRRYEAGVTLRSMMESIYGSGVKSPDYESVGGGGGAGVVIHAVVAENIRNIDTIKRMMSGEWFRFLEQMLLHGRFVWQIPSQKGSDMVIDEIRQALDKVSLYLGTMPPEEEDVDVPKRVDRNEVRQNNRLARDLIAQAQRQAR